MTNSHPLPTDDERRTSDRLLESLEKWRDADGVVAPEAFVAEHATDDRAIIEHAEGALMMRYGIDSYQAFAVMVRWSRMTHTPVHTVAHTLIHGICEGNPQTEFRHRPLMRWLEDQLRDNDPDPARLPTAPVWSRTGP